MGHQLWPTILAISWGSGAPTRKIGHQLGNNVKIVKNEKLTENQKIIYSTADALGEELGTLFTKRAVETLCKFPFSDDMSEVEILSFLAKMNSAVTAAALTMMAKISAASEDSGNNIHILFDEIVAGVRFMLDLPETKHQIEEIKSMAYQEKVRKQLDDSYKKMVD